MKCHTCKKEFDHISSHWTQSKTCDYPNLSQHQKEIIKGLKLGDGCIYNRRLILVNTNKKFLDYLKNKFIIFPAKIRNKKSYKRQGEFTKYHNYKPAYTLGFTHPWLENLNKEKVYLLTPTILKYWYVCDGSLNYRKNDNRRNVASIHAENPHKANFKKLDINPSFGRNRVYFNINETVKFFKIIGDPIPGFRYKWPNELITDKHIQENIINLINTLSEDLLLKTIANKFGVDRHTITNWKNRKTIPHYRTFKM